MLTRQRSRRELFVSMNITWSNGDQQIELDLARGDKLALTPEQGSDGSHESTHNDTRAT